MELQTATREELIQLIVEQSMVIAELRAQIAVLEGDPSKQGGASPPAWVKRNRPKAEKKPRRKRARGYARKRSKPTRQVTHAVDREGVPFTVES